MSWWEVPLYFACWVVLWLVVVLWQSKKHKG